MINFTYLKQPLRPYTFEAPKTKKWVESRCKGIVLNLFAGKTKLNVTEIRNDIDRNMIAGFHLDAYDFVRTFKGNKFDTILLDPPYCYDDQTEILTEKGWKYFKDLDKTEKVATLNPKTHYLEYQKPINYINENYKGKMIKIKSGAIDLKVTPNHLLYVRKNWYSNKFKLIKANEVNFGCNFKSNCKWEGKEQKYFYLPEISFKRHNRYNQTRAIDKKLLMDDWLRFFGIWLAEGCVDNKGTDYRIRIAQIKVKNRNIIQNWIQKIGYHYLIDKNGFAIYNKQLCVYLRQFGKAKDKFIPQEFKKLSSRQLKILLDSMILGDGCKYYENRWNKKYHRFYVEKRVTYSSSSKKLIDDVSEIVLKCGMSSTFYVAKHVNYVIGITSHRLTPRIAKEKLDEYFKENFYNGKIYCVEIPNHIIYVRRNGKSVWCGNSYRKGMEKYKGHYTSKFNLIKEEIPKILNKNGIVITFGYHCLDEKTECLTKNGWKYYYELNKNDEVATFNKENEDIEYNKIRNIFLYDYDGKLKYITNRYIDQLVTFNHNVVLKYKHINNDKKGNNKIWVDNKWKIVESSSITPHLGVYIPNSGYYKNNISITNEIAELLGWIIAEGHQMPCKSIFIYQSKKVNKKNVDRIRYLLKKCELHFSEKIYIGKPDLVNFYIHKKKNRKFYKNIIDKYLLNVKIPKWELLHIKYEELESLFDGLIGGDGSRRTNKSCIFYQKSDYIREWLQVLCCHLGYRTSNNLKYGVVNITFVNRNLIAPGKHFRKMIKNVDYKGKIWCINVKNNCFVIKRNNKISITGNSTFMGKKRGFILKEICLICHGGAQHDTIAIIEQKL